MQILNAIIRKYRAFKDFWHTHIATYTYIDLYPHLKTSLDTNNSTPNKNNSIDSACNIAYNKERETIESIQPYVAQNETGIESSMSFEGLSDSKDNNEKLESSNYDLRFSANLNNNESLDSIHSTLQNTAITQTTESLESSPNGWVQGAVVQNRENLKPSPSVSKSQDFISKSTQNLDFNTTACHIDLEQSEREISSIELQRNLDSKNYALNPAAHPNSAQNLDSKPACYVERSETSNIESKTDFSLNAQNDNKQNLDFIKSMPQSSTSAQVAQNPDSKNHALNSQPQADLTRNLYSTQYTQTTNKNPSTKDTIHSTQNLTQANLIPLLHALKKPYITLDQLNSNHTKPHPLANIFHRKKSMRMYYTILPLNSLEASNIDIEKSELKSPNMLDSIVPLKAKSNGLIPYNHECKYFLQNQNKTHFNFQLFAIKSEVLESYALKYSGKILCLNPLEMFSSLFTLYPHLKRYTIIFQGSSKHALCHYTQGFLTLSVVLERTEALQNYYSLIEDFGEIFYCDFSGKADLLLDFKDIASLFNLPLKECLQLLALEYIRTKPAYIHFYARAFYSMRSFLKMLLFATLCIFIFYFLALFYHKYEYFQYLRHEALTHSTQIDSLYHKKQQYPLMYEKLFENLLTKQSLNFCLQQDYNEIESTWIQTDCNKP
ncbi:hypothetical protein [Helicobacter bilis]|uniref:hypothetical protein n=1 Tax=Helicobacter bilis TaxID=37372 RepID=UPI002557FF3D|nr:hypothetical protein [Helicobacter bilis]